MKVTIELPKVGRRRLIATAVLCAVASMLWIAGPIWLPYVPFLPDADLTWRLVLVGLVCPAGVGYVTLLLMEQRIVRDLQPAERRERAEAVSHR